MFVNERWPPKEPVAVHVMEEKSKGKRDGFYPESGAEGKV